MLFCTSLLAFVGAGEQPTLSPRKLTLFNTHNNAAIQSLSFPSSVLSVLLNRKRLVAVLDRRAFLYNLESLELLATLDTRDNPKGVGALAPCSGSLGLLALPAADTAGAVRVYDTQQNGVEVLCEIPAHKTPLALAAWSSDGSLLATASQRGTVVRVHALPSAATTHTLRRGTTPAHISGLAFTPGPASPSRPTLLCVASNHGTVHIYRLNPPSRHPAAVAAASLLSAVMPATVAQAVEPSRPLLTVRLPKGAAGPCCCAVHCLPDGDEQAGAAAGGDDQRSRLRSGQATAAMAADAFTLSVASCRGILYSYRVEGGWGGRPPRSFLEGEWRLVAASN